MKDYMVVLKSTKSEWYPGTVRLVHVGAVDEEEACFEASKSYSPDWLVLRAKEVIRDGRR